VSRTAKRERATIELVSIEWVVMDVDHGACCSLNYVYSTFSLQAGFQRWILHEARIITWRVCLASSGAEHDSAMHYSYFFFFTFSNNNPHQNIHTFSLFYTNSFYFISHHYIFLFPKLTIHYSLGLSYVTCLLECILIFARLICLLL
jgi:hypothetical protein